MATVDLVATADETLDTVRALYERGLYLQAYRASEPLGPLKDWTGPEARILAARLLGHLGAPRRSLWHRLRAWRETPAHPSVRYYRGWTLLEQSSPYETWRFLQDQGDMPDAPAEDRASWYALHAQVASVLRDFDLADHWLRRALDVGGDRPWVHVTRSAVLEREDRYAEALAAADEALSLQPWFRPAVQSRSHLLTLLERDDEAFEFLQQAAGQIECASLYFQVAGIQFEREEHAAVEDSLARFEEMSPLLEPHFGQAFYSLRSFLAYRRGDDEAAIAWARRGDDECDRKVVERLSDPALRERPRVLLPVGFTRQHHMTCVPATLATISRYWSMPAEHLQVAEEICYNGTSACAERRWATENGWKVREFTVTEESAQRLIDAGVPFTLTTTEPGNGHLQAVVGYDARRGSLLIRDPYLRQRRELFADALLERYAPFGPRGMALVPQAEAHRLRALDLPDAELWDQLHAIDRALIEHRRAEAARLVEQLQQQAPEHVLTWQAQWRLATYDANLRGELAAIERLLERFPDNDVLQLSRLGLLRHLARRQERFDTLAATAERADAHPRFLMTYAQELAQDARDHDRAMALLGRVLRLQPSDPAPYYVMATIVWDEMEFERALELYRFAASLDDKDEQLADAYFRAAQYCRRTDEALDWLRRRFERFGGKSSHPARTLDGALRRLERTTEALEVLESAMAQRPDDGDLRLHAAGVFAATSSEYTGRAQEMLEQARGHCPEVHWLRGAARLASYCSDSREALRLYREVLALQPLALDAHQAVAQFLAETESRAAALDHLRGAVDQFPHYQPLLECYIEWLREEPPETVEPVVRRLIEVNPANAWAIRELGFLLLRQGRLDEAAACADEAGLLEPTNASWMHLRGGLLAEQGRLAEARQAFREAIRLSVDNRYALNELLACCNVPEERREELEFVRQELKRQMIYGDGLLGYRAHAHRTLEPDELHNLLHEALEARPDLWHAWSACVQQAVSMERLDEAEDLARQATERFPLLPRLWFDLANVYRARGDEARQLAALEAGHRVNPAWGEIQRALSDIYLNRGELERSRTLLEAAVASDPLDGVNRGFLAEVLWRQERRDEALEQMERAVTLSPGYEWAWGMLGTWSKETGRPELPEQAVRRLVEARPGEARSWLMLARVLRRDEQLDERLAALRKAAELYPRGIEAYNQLAKLLAAAGRYDEALAACRAEVWGTAIPPELQARAAWVEWVRGRHTEAVAQLRAVLEADPMLASGWQMLADWQGDLGDHTAALNAARMMVRLNPYEAIPLGYLAEALLRTDARAEAKAAFGRAFEIDPAYLFAGMWLFDLQLDDDERDAAAQTLDRLRQSETGPFLQARAVRLAARQGDMATALPALRSICLDECDSDWPLRTACQAFCDADWLTELDNLLDEMLDQPDVYPEVGTLWAERQQALGRDPSAERLPQLLLTRGRVGERAVYAWVKGLIRAGEPGPLRRFVRRNRHWLRESTYGWGAVGFGWTSLHDWKNAVRWLSDWRERSDAQPWMLVNVAEALRVYRRDAEAADVSRHALQIPPGHGVELHRLWLAVDDFVAGRYAEADQVVQAIDPQSLDADYRLLHTLLTCSLDIAQAEPAERPARFTMVRRDINAAVAGYRILRFEPARRRFYFHCLKQIARHVRTPAARLWSLWRWAVTL